MALKFRNVPTSSIAVTPVSSNAGKNQPRFLRVSKPTATMGQVRLSREDASDPEAVSRAINDLHKKLEQSTRAQRSAPDNGAIYFQNLSLTQNQAFTIHHNLGRPFSGYQIVRSYTGAGACQLVETTLPAGLTADKAIQLIPTATGKYDIKVY